MLLLFMRSNIDKFALLMLHKVKNYPTATKQGNSLSLVSGAPDRTAQLEKSPAA